MSEENTKAVEKRAQEEVPEAAVTEIERDAYGFEVVDNTKTAHQDFLTAVILMVVSITVIIVSLGYWKKQNVTFYASAGFVPVLFSSGLLIMCIRLLRESLQSDSTKNMLARIKKGAIASVKSNIVHRSIIGLAIFGVYVFFMLGSIPFWLASFLALAGVLVFVRYDKTLTTTLKMLLIAALCVAGIVLLFQYAFNVPMP